MNKQNIAKLRLFLLGLSNRFNENSSIYKGIYITYQAGLKKFNGIGHLDNDNISYNFNGKTEVMDITSFFNKIADEAENYDFISVLFRERGSDILISGDNKNVKMTTTDVKDDEISSTSTGSKNTSTHNPETSTLLNRDYYIKIGKADDLLKELGIMSKDGKVKNDKIRKYNQIDHYVELLEGILDTLPENETINLLDCGCGKSYLSFVLNYYLTEVKKRKCHFIGIDYSESVIDTCKKMAKNLDYRNMDFYAMDIKDFKLSKKIHVVISLHACDTATDMALALGLKVKSDVIIAVPCCQKELLNQYSYEPFKNITKYGPLKARMADVLTDGMRSMFLEGKGYSVSVIEYISPLETPKNLMIRAVRTGKENASAIKDYSNLVKVLKIDPFLRKFYNELERGY
jgi:SAM-dependent methyltransferase